eukprot:88073_1
MLQKYVVGNLNQHITLNTPEHGFTLRVEPITFEIGERLYTVILLVLLMVSIIYFWMGFAWFLEFISPFLWYLLEFSCQLIWSFPLAALVCLLISTVFIFSCFGWMRRAICGCNRK